MTNYREILRLDSLGLNKTQISEASGYSRTTVIQVLRQAEANGIRYPVPEGMSDKELFEKLYPSKSGKPEYKMPDYEYVHKELQKSGVTLKLLWLEYCEQCRNSGEQPYQSTQFNKYYNDYVVKNDAVMHLNHKPGEIMQVDWAGNTAAVTNTDTGEAIPAYIFVAALPYSGYTYAEAFFSMNQECWIAAHVNAYKYFGGVTRILQCDNLKTGVISHGRNEIVLNKTYSDLAEHYGTAIIPCRIRSPRDKAMVEGTVGVISSFILAAIRNRNFLSIEELNKAIFERLYEFNHKSFQKREGSRFNDFAEEKLFLLPLPSTPFEMAEWRIASVSPDYHILADKMKYSVPYEYIHQKVDVRITKSTVEIFFEGNRICSHRRLYGKANQYSTIEDHMPPDHRQYIQWNGEKFRLWAGEIGENTYTVVNSVLSEYRTEQQGYKVCMGIMKLADKYNPERLENACKKALTYTPSPSLKHIQTILSSKQDIANKEKNEENETSSQYGFTRGAEYYGRKK